MHGLASTHLIPFAQRVLPAAEAEAPILVHELLNAATAVDPSLRTARMMAKKGVSEWADIGIKPPAPLSERIAATARIVDRFMNQAWLDGITATVKAQLGGKSKLAITFPRAFDEGSLNLIPAAMAAKLQQHLKTALPEVKVLIDRGIHQASKANRTSAADAASLLARQQIFEGPVAHDTAHLLLDEHIESGATLRGLDSYIRQHGGHVAAIAALTKNPAAEHVRIRPSTLQAIEAACPTRLDRQLLDSTLAKLGLSLPTLTNTEGLAIVAHLSHNKTAFDTLLRNADSSLAEFNSQGGAYITKALDAPTEQKTVAALAHHITRDLGEHYHYLGAARR